MATLSKEFRRQLERVVLAAREEAEKGAFETLNVLGLTETKVPPHLNEVEERLRRRLRAHGKQGGDTQTSDREWDISHLIHECAYEHWHRMLFARFLAENHMLIEPEMQVAISLEEAEELAREANEDMWAFASRCAQCMLPQIFRPEDPLLRLDFAREHRLKLEALLNDLDAA